MFEFVAKPSPFRLALMALGSLVFVNGGAWMGGWLGADHPQAPAWLPWAAIGFFGLAFVVLVKRMFDKDDMVRIGAGGIWIRQVANGQAIPWSEIAAIGVWEHKRQRFFLLQLHHPERFPAQGLSAMLASANRSMTGADLSFSLTGTDRSFDEAMETLRRYWNFEDGQ